MGRRKTALVLSGGGSRGAYQCGVWQALVELGIKIDIVVGVSVGALNGSMVVDGDVIKTANLWRDIETDMVFDVEADAGLPELVTEILLNGGAGTTGLQDLIARYVDEDALRKSPVDYGLLTIEIPSMKPHYLWKEDIPEGKLHDYITASASLFPALQAHEIDGKHFIDGGYEDVMPVLMPLEKGATDIIAVYLKAAGRLKHHNLKKAPNLTLIESKWDLGSVLFFDKDHTNRIMRLGYMDAMKAYGVYDGEYYSFIKGTFGKNTMKSADAAAKVFQLDPLILYGRESLLEALAKEIDKVADIFQNEKPIESLKEAVKISNKKLLTLFIIDNMKEFGKKSIFATPSAAKILKDEVAAARFILKAGLL
ncbi:MAG: patatin-like phospholipase family protein [Eubacteriaceae bacterium]|nr:patatin-like phospholipase family protein [Eubacteriaceae bacterium]